MSFEEWFRPQLPRLVRFATVLCGGPDPAEEVVQEVAIRAHARWDKIARLDHPESYLRRMVVNEHLSWRRKWSRLVPHAELIEPPAGGRGFDDDQADRAQLVQELNKLPRRQKAVLVLRFFEDLPDIEIAELLGCSTGTVRSHASRALAALRIELVDPPRIPITTEEDSRAY